MSDESFIGGRTDSVTRLAKEVTDLKGVLQDISQQIRRIERRIDYVLPHEKRSQTRKASNGVKKTPTMSETNTRETIERMKQHLYDEKPVAEIQSELRKMNVKRELTPIAREFGMTNAALPPKDELIMRIITRIQQSVMLTENIRKMPRVAEEEKRFGGR